LHAVTPIQLATQSLVALRERNELDTRELDDVVLGCVTPIGEQGANIARTAVLTADYAQSVPGQQLNRFCASGLEAVNTAAAHIMCGQADAMVAGGVESMSRVQMGADGGAVYADPQVTYKNYYVPQGISADLIATLDGYTREQLDGYAVASQSRAALAAGSGYFSRSIIAVRDGLGNVLLDRDEHLRPGTTLEDLARLKPAFTALGEQAGFDAVALQRYPQLESIRHLHTGGNSSGIVDGAAVVLLGSKGFGARAGLRPRARVRAFCSIGSEPTIMLTAPSLVTEKLLKRAGMSVSDIDLFEVNEAFAAVVMRFMNALQVPHDKVNVNGGAIALGHPLGATGAMLVGTALDELERRNLGTAIVTMCIGAGMGTATLIERM
jgi:acetyl-CoA C-acetyltransferase